MAELRENGVEEVAEAAPAASIWSAAFLLTSLVNVLVFTGFQMLNTGLPVYLDQLGANSFQVGLMATLATLGALLCRPFTGVLVDRYGRKGFLVAGFVTMALCSVGYAVFPLIGVILAFRFVHGLGWGFSSTANMTIIADILPRNRFGEGMGYFAMTTSLAVALGPALAMWLVEAGQFQLMIWISGGLSVLAILGSCVTFAFYREPPRRTERRLRDSFTLRNMFVRESVFPAAVMGILCFSFGTVGTFIALMAAQRGIDNLSLYFVVYAIANLVTRPLVGKWVDRHGFWWAGILSCICVATSIALIAVAQSLAVICVAGVLVGTGMGTAMSVLNTMSIATARPERRGAATSTYQFFFNGGMALGSLAGGLLVDALGYAGMFLVMAAVCLVACGVFAAGGRAKVDRYHDLQHH